MLDPAKSLYHRLGGYDVLAAVIDDLLPRLVDDPQIGVYWKGKCKESLKEHRQRLIDFLCAALGGPVTYTGRDMRTSHDGLRISDSDWNVFVAHTMATLDDLAIPDQEKKELLAAADSLKGDIVEVSHGVAET